MTAFLHAAWSLTTGLALTIGIFLAALAIACTVGFALLVAWDWMRGQAAGRRVDALDEVAETWIFNAPEFRDAPIFHDLWRERFEADARRAACDRLLAEIERMTGGAA